MSPHRPVAGRPGRALALAAAAAVLGLVLPAAAAGPLLGLAGQAGSAAVAVLPATLAAGASCNGQCATTLNGAGTALTVGTLNILPNPSQSRQLAKVVHGTLPWSVQVRATAAALGPADTVVLTLAGTASASLTLTAATALPATSAAVAMAGGAGAGDLTLSARGSCAGTCTLALEVVLSSGTARYAYAVTATVT